MSIILSSAYNAPIQYYTKFLLGEDILIEQHETYVKQSYRNRCIINATDGAMPLSIPVVYSSSERTKMNDVLISDHGNWQHTHWNAIVSAYNSTPFFEYYRDDYEQLYFQEYVSLIDFNDRLLRLTLQNLHLQDVKFNYTSCYYESQLEGDIDYRNSIHPKQNYSQDERFVAKEYYQIFADRNGFIPNLTILDLLFNMGNESILVLQSSIR